MLTRFGVLVSNWSRDRVVCVDENFIYFHTTLACVDCGTCIWRAKSVRESLDASGAEWEWAAPQELLTEIPAGVRIARIKRIAGELPLDQLRRQLNMGLEVHPNVWERTAQFEQRNAVMDAVAAAFRPE